MKRGRAIVLRALCIGCALLALMLGTAQAEKYALIRGEAGYDGVIIDGAAVPIEITVKATDEDIDGVVRVNVYTDDGKYDAVEHPLTVKGGETKTIRMSVKPGAPQHSFELAYIERDGTTIANGIALGSSVIEYDYQKLIAGVLGSDSLCQAVAASMYDEGDDVHIEAVPLDADVFMQTNEEMYVWSVLVIDDFDVGVLTDGQQALLRSFVRNGGIVLLGAGTETANSLEWFGELTGVKAGAVRNETGDVIDAVAQYVGLRYEKNATEQSDKQDSGMAVRALTGGEALVQMEDVTLMSAADVGSGLVITCGFSLTDPTVNAAAGDHALWQRVLLTCDANHVRDRMGRQGSGNGYRMGSYTNEYVKVARSGSILPVAVLLAAYAAVAGLGLYVILRRVDRSAWMWAAVPMAAVVFTGIVALFGAMLGINKPIAVSTRLTILDENDGVTAEEIVSLAYAGQDRVTISTEGGEALRCGVSGYASYDDTTTGRELRNIVRAGEEPFIELEGLATWISRCLRVESEKMPQGKVEASAWFEADGLHVDIKNGLDVGLENAVLLTNYGYKRLGNLAAGESISTGLLLSEGVRMDENHDILIDEGKWTMCSVGMERAIDFCVNPENAQGEKAVLDDKESAERSEESRKLRFGIRYDNVSDFECVIVADVPQIPCAQLTANGEKITRTQQTSVLVKYIAADTAGQKGVPFIPMGEIDAIKCAVDASGKPQMKSTDVSVGPGRGCFGFTIDRIAPEDITRIVFETWRWDLIVEIYNHETGKWTQLGDGGVTIIEHAEAVDFVNESGEIFIRYAAPSEIAVDEDEVFDAPAISVEGGWGA